MREFHEVANIFPFMQGDEFDALKADIREHGQREPIWLHPDGRIIDGRNRYLACVDLGIEPKYRTWDGKGSLVAFSVSLNLSRRHLTSSQKAALTPVILPMLEKEAEEERRRKISEYQRNGETTQKFGESNRHDNESTAHAAQILGTNRQYASEAKKLSQQSPEILNMVRDGTVTMEEGKTLAKMDEDKRMNVLGRVGTGGAENVKDALKQIAKEEKAAAAQSIVCAPERTYNVVYLDPPWEYSNTGVHGAAEHHYPTMSISELRDLFKRINLRLADNAVMFLWITNPLMAEAFGLIKDWGFEYKTNIVWVKTELKKPGSGFYVRGRHELLFICTRGNFTPLDENISPPIGSVISAPVQEHSKKPDEVYQIIERLYPGCSYIELFARQKREGWYAWGNETDKFTS